MYVMLILVIIAGIRALYHKIQDVDNDISMDDPSLRLLAVLIWGCHMHGEALNDYKRQLRMGNLIN